MKPKILIIDDEIHIVELIKFNLETSGYEVDIAYDGLDGYLKIKENIPHLVLLDWMLPNISGIDMLKKIRSEKSLSDIPVIMLTAKNMESDKIEGLELGADDYITKPYNPTILLLHIEAVFKRLHKNETKLLYHDIKVDLMKSTLKNENQELILSKNEMGIFYFLLMNQGKIVTRDDIMNYLWGTDKFIDDNTLTVNMTRLRKRLEKIGLYNVIETRRDQGYILI